jgi:hypothetical protein
MAQLGNAVGQKKRMNDQSLREILSTARTIAVVGLSSNPIRPSFGVSEYMQSRGYRIIPVNPNETEVLGEKAYSSLAEVHERIDIVNVFRRSEFVPEVAQAAIESHARCLWLQEGVVHPIAVRQAEQAGLLVVVDRCILKEHRRLLR